jgi:cytochrome c-type biogenesis protein
MLMLAFLAGVLSILSPCVLPLVPVILAGALAEHRLAPVALAGGLAVSFAGIGLLMAVIGFSIGLDANLFRVVASFMLIMIGIVLVSERLQLRTAALAGPVANWANGTQTRISIQGIPGQFLVGLLLGLVWTPCVGPTLGAASVMALRGENLATAISTMAVFGIGAALPLLVLGLMSRELLKRWNQRIFSAAPAVKIGLGMFLIALGVMSLTGWDRSVQTYLEGITPDWLFSLTTQL